MEAPITVDVQQMRRFLQLLGKNGDSRLRAFPHKGTPPGVKKQLQARKFGRDINKVLSAQHDGLGVYAVINEGGDTKASIRSCVAFFAEFDGVPEDEQLSIVRESGLPDPSIIVATGGGSLHFYWVLTEPVRDTEQWQSDMKRLAAFLGSDPSINDPSRVMRLPGCWYMGADQKPVAKVQMLHEGKHRYSRDEVMANVPELRTTEPVRLPTSPAPLAKASSDETPGARALRQLQSVPPRIPGSNTRDLYLRLLWALSSIVGPEQAAAAFSVHSEEWAAVDDLTEIARDGRGDIKEGTFFQIVRQEWGITDQRAEATAAEPLKGGADGAEFDPEDDDAALDREALERFQQAQKAELDPVDAMGEFWGQLLIERAEAFPCDPAILSVGLLCYVASLVGSKARIRVKQGWDEPLLLWAMVAMAAGSMKSPTGKVFGGPLSELQWRAAQDWGKAQAKFKQRDAEWKKACNQLRKDAQKAGVEPELPDGPEAPAPSRHYFVEAITFEKLAAIQAQPNVPGLLAFHDELAEWFNSLERNTKTTDRARWLKLWNGGAIKHDTNNGVTAFAKHSAVSILGYIQEDKLAALHAAEASTDRDSAGDGLWSRFIPLLAKRVPFTFNTLEREIGDDLLQLAAQLEAIPAETRLDIHPDAINNVLAPTWNAWAREEENCSSSRGAFLSKLRGYSVRIAGLLHLLQTQTNFLITEPTAAKAVRICNFFLAQFDQLAPQISGSGDVEAPVARFLQKVKDRDLKEVTPREVQQWKILGRKTKSAEAHAFLEGLANQGIGKFIQRHPKGSKRGAWVWTFAGTVERLQKQVQTPECQH